MGDIFDNCDSETENIVLVLSLILAVVGFFIFRGWWQGSPGWGIFWGILFGLLLCTYLPVGWVKPHRGSTAGDGFVSLGGAMLCFGLLAGLFYLAIRRGPDIDIPNVDMIVYKDSLGRTIMSEEVTILGLPRQIFGVLAFLLLFGCGYGFYQLLANAFATFNRLDTWIPYLAALVVVAGGLVLLAIFWSRLAWCLVFHVAYIFMIADNFWDR